MSITGKVHNGATTFERLCDTCRYSTIMQGQGQKEYIWCRGISWETAVIVPCRVVKCNRYDDKRDNTPDLNTLSRMAYILTEDTPLKTAGFVTPHEWRKKHKDDDIVPSMPPGVPYDP